MRISDSALVDAAVLSDRYIADRFLPDKAIDLVSHAITLSAFPAQENKGAERFALTKNCALWQVDEAAAKLKMEITSKPQHLDEIDRKILQLEMERLSLAKVCTLFLRQLTPANVNHAKLGPVRHCFAVFGSTNKALQIRQAADIV